MVEHMQRAPPPGTGADTGLTAEAMVAMPEQLSHGHLGLSEREPSAGDLAHLGEKRRRVVAPLPARRDRSPTARLTARPALRSGHDRGRSATDVAEDERHRGRRRRRSSTPASEGSLDIEVLRRTTVVTQP